MSNERTGVLELTLGDSYIGSAYSPSVEVTDTETGHEVAITYMSPSGLVTERFDVADGEQGPQGPAGFSPTVTITDTPTGHTVTITDEDGPHSYDVPNYAREEAARQAAWNALSGEVTDAISDAETATSAASTAAQSATSAATSATSAAQAATTAAASANTAASSANAAATAATTAASAASTAADAATTAAQDATDAASAANTAAQAAQEAATEVAPDVANLTDGMTHLHSFVVGTLNSSGGIAWGPYAISNSEDMVFPYPVSLEIADDYQFRALFKPNGSESYQDTGYLATPYNLPANTPFKATVRRTGDTSTPADIPLMSRKLLVKTATEYKANEAYSQAKKLTNGMQLIDANFSLGSLVNGNYAGNVKYRVSTPYVVRYDRALTFHVDSGFRCAIHTFDSSDAFVSDLGWKYGNFSIDANQGFKIIVARVSEDTSEIADVDVFRNAISIDTPFADGVNSVIGNVFNEPFMQPNKPMLVAHMGLHDATTYPENTLPAFKAAGAAGMWGIETDVQVTADGKYVCIHDTTLDRTTTGTGNVNEKTLAEIRELRIKDYPNLQVPTFEEYLGACKAYGCVPAIELKGTIPNTAEAVVPIIEIIKSIGLYNKCVLFGSKWRADNVRNADSRIPYVGIFQHGAYADYAPEIAFMKQVPRCGVALEVSGTITAEMVQECHAANMPIFAFVVDDSTAAYDWFAFGADAITTNKVTELS